MTQAPHQLNGIRMNRTDNNKDYIARRLETLSFDELNEILVRIQALVGKKLQDRKQLAMRELEIAASRYGFDLIDLVKSEIDRSGPRNDKQVSQRYVHPENPNLTWAGRGRHPKWFKEMIIKGFDPRVENVNEQ